MYTQSTVGGTTLRILGRIRVDTKVVEVYTEGPGTSVVYPETSQRVPENFQNRMIDVLLTLYIPMCTNEPL